MARWQLPAAAVLATVSVVVPLTAVPLAASTLVAGAGDVALAAFLAASFGALAYAGLFVAAGLWFRRAVWWGLAFVLVWENVVANTAEGAARFTVNGWASSVLGLAPDVDVSDAGGVRRRRVRRPRRDRGRRLAGRDVALPPGRHRLSGAAQATRPSSTQPLWPPRPIAFESATSSSTVCSRASFGT